MFAGALILLLSPACMCQSSLDVCPEPTLGTGDATEVCIAGGSFRLGAEPLPILPTAVHLLLPENDWAPAHEVVLSPYYIDAYEVTWRRYRRCIDSGVCTTQGPDMNPSTQEAVADPALENRPAGPLLYEEARIFCEWEGKRLPTEAEWERAARGFARADYPWGNSRPSQQILDAPTAYYPYVGDAARYPAPVGRHSEDVTFEGVHDLFGNLPEWVLDWYDPRYYANSQGAVDPRGPDASPTGQRVTRGNRWSIAGGGSWDVEHIGAPAWFRDRWEPFMAAAGVRCAHSLTAPRASNASSTRAGFPKYPPIEWHPVRRSGR